MVQPSSRRTLFLLGPQRQNVGPVLTSRKKGLTEPGSLTNTNRILITNRIENRIEKNCLLCILSSVPRALGNRSDHIDIPSTQPQHRSSKGSRRPTKARKPGSFRKRIPIRRMHNRTDKLTLTRQFWIQFEIFLGGCKEWECNKIHKKRFSVDSNAV